MIKRVRISLLRVLEKICTWLEMKLYGENLPDVVDLNGELQEDNTYLLEKLKKIEAMNETLETDNENLQDALNFLKR